MIQNFDPPIAAASRCLSFWAKEQFEFRRGNNAALLRIRFDELNFGIIL